MTTTTITREGREWLWPAYDTELIKVFDQFHDIAKILPYVTEFSSCVQAGGACGVWPYYLRENFDNLYSFEPDPVNFECLRRNAPRVLALPYALSDTDGTGAMVRHPSEARNAGAGYVAEGQGVRTIRLDAAYPRDERCGLLLLDVEGREEQALRGGSQMITRCKPVIVIEEKPLPQGGDHLAARRLLESWGYVERERFHRDVLFTC